MTIMRVSLAGTQLIAKQKEEMASRLITAFATIECGHAAPEVLNGFLVSFDELDRNDLWMGAAPMVDSSASGKAAVVNAHVMAGPWDDEMKAALFESIESVIRDVADMPKEDNGSNFWMTIVEVPEGAWGFGGKAVSIASLAPVFAKDRRERIERYLERHRTENA